MRKSPTAENFSRFVVAMIVVTVVIAALVWAFSSVGPECAAGVPCHPNGQAEVVHY
jgi:hypothetical protein